MWSCYDEDEEIVEQQFREERYNKAWECRAWIIPSTGEFIHLIDLSNEKLKNTITWLQEVNQKDFPLRNKFIKIMKREINRRKGLIL